MESASMLVHSGKPVKNGTFPYIRVSCQSHGDTIRFHVIPPLCIPVFVNGRNIVLYLTYAQKISLVPGFLIST